MLQAAKNLKPQFDALTKERDEALAALKTLRARIDAIEASRGITTQKALPATASKSAPVSKGADQLLGGFDTATPRQVARKDVGSISFDGRGQVVRKYALILN
jgi:hypothetical protein